VKKVILSYLPESIIEKDKRNLFLTFIFIAMIMLIVEYFGWQGPFLKIGKYFSFVRADAKSFTFYAQVFTSLSFMTFFFILPLIFNFFFPIDADKGTGLGSFDTKTSLKTYLPIVIIMLPVIWIATSSPGFYRFYPLYRPESLKMFFVYELIYATQFIGIEYFFRGFGLFRLEKVMPGYGIAIMVIPYSFVHIHKPFPEAVGSVIAGIILGHLALKTRSIWPGVFTHIAIALSADTFSLVHSGTMSKLISSN
jgi:uncharacterized protein